MIDDGIFFSYQNPGKYAESVQRVRDRLGAWAGRYYVLTDRKTKTLRRFAVAIFDEKNQADIDVCLMGNTLYILAMRLAEHKWYKTKKQPLEFAGCDSSISAELPFEGGYGELGILNSSAHPQFTLEQASTHAAAMKDYMLAFAAGKATAELEKRCKLAFAFFAMTIAEAARFNNVEAMMYHGGINPAEVIPILQRWVINSSVRDDAFPSDAIAIAGIHEQRSGKVWKNLVANLEANPKLAPTDAELAGDSDATQEFLGKQGAFAGADKLSKAAASRGTMSGFQSGREFLLDAFFRSRLDPQLIIKARAQFDRLRSLKTPVTQPMLAGLQAE